MKQVFEIVAKSLSEFFQTKYIAFFQLDESKDKLILKHSSGFQPESIENLNRIKPSMDIFQRLIEGKIFQIENEIFKNEQELASLVKLDGLESMIGVPILKKGEIWGILTVFSQDKHKFKKENGETLTLWATHMPELQEFFSSYLQTKLDENLVQILGNIELLKFRLRSKKNICASDIVDALDYLENAILEGSQNLDRIHVEPTFEEKAEKKPVEEIFEEEVITVEGEKIPSAEGRRVLIVDDQPIITDLLVDILRRMGYSSEVALGGKDALKIFAKDDFDLVITDLGMPDLSGWEVSKSVKEQNPSVPVILITGWGVEPDPHKMKDSRVDFVINKPFQLDQLEKIIKDLIDAKRSIIDDRKIE